MKKEGKMKNPLGRCLLGLLLGWIVLVSPGAYFETTVIAQTHWLRVGQTDFPGGLGQAFVSDGTDLYVLRQFLENNPISFQRLTVKEGLVVQTTNLTPPLFDLKDGTAMAFDPDGNLYVMFGGTYSDRRQYVARFTAAQWTPLAPTPFEQGPGDALTFVSHRGQRYLYALIGAARSRRADAVTAFIRYSFSDRKWETLPVPPWDCNDGGAALAWDGGEFVYALQGTDCNQKPTDTFARFYLTLGLWDRLSGVPKAVSRGGSLVRSGSRYLFAATGSDTEFQGRGFFAYDLTRQAWEETPPLNCSIGDYNGNRLAVIDGRTFYWQGAPPTWTDSAECNGRGIYLFSWR